MEKLREILNKIDIDISDKQLKQFNDYYELLVEWNSFMNLTSITEKDDVIIKHFLDSLMVLKFADVNGKSFIDVGTGAGFPGIPIKIMCPDSNVVLLDSLNKRVKFLNEVIDKLSLSNIQALHYRAEDGAHEDSLREKFDFCFSRAVSNLSTLSEYCIPFVKVNGQFISYKSSDSEEEINNSKNAIKILGGKIFKVENFELPDSDFGRSFVFIDKIDNTKNKYPRKAGMPKNSPLK